MPKTRPLAQLGPWPVTRSPPGARPELQAFAMEPTTELGLGGALQTWGGPTSENTALGPNVGGLAVPLTCRCKLAAAAMHSGRQGARLT